MELNSPIFLFLFLPVFMFAYHVAAYRAKLVVGILGSLLFYAWGNLKYVPLMLVLTVATYFWARGIDHRRGQRISSFLLWGGVIANVALLVGIKLWAGVKIPLGLSYVTFQVMAYLFEVYKERIESEPDALKFAFYLLLFPKIPVGPIVRYSSVKNQIEELRAEPTEIADGFRRFIRGLAKKALIADTLARVVNPIFRLASPTIPPSWAWLVLVGYSVQLFFDFSGYTDMAIGLGRMIGLQFMENFNFPYLSKSIGDFWRRWHISLSSWFRDFVFYPLERHRLKYIGQPLNILIVFLLVVLWHGLEPTFMIWGVIHGMALVFESSSLGRKVIALPSPVRNLYALSVILVGWVFFRSPNAHFALGFLGRLLGDTNGLKPLPFELTTPLPFIEPTFVIALVAGLIFCFPLGQWIGKIFERFVHNSQVVKVSAQVLYDFGLVFLLLVSIAATTSAAFVPNIYGRF